MTYDAYIRNIHAKTGMTLEDFRKAAAVKAPMKVGQATEWLKSEYNLGHGHANTIAQFIVNPDYRNASAEEKLALQFAGSKQKWRQAYEDLVCKVRDFGDDVGIAPARSYVSLTRSGVRFGLINVASSALCNVGLKLKGVAPVGCLEDAGTWNAMVTHRIRVHSPAMLAGEALPWLATAYARAA